MAHTLASIMGTLAPPVAQEIEHWPPSALREKRMKPGGKVVRHELHAALQKAEGEIFRAPFAEVRRPRSVGKLTASEIGRS